MVVVGDYECNVRLSTVNDPVTIKATNQAVKEKVVVVSHGGVVEDRSHLRAPGVLDQQFSRFGVRIDSIYKIKSQYPLKSLS